MDQLCIRTRWVIRDAAGVETPGPLDGSPAAINALDVAVGTSDRSAIRYHVPSGADRVLHAADAAHSAEATHINDLGEVVGRVTRIRTRQLHHAIPAWPCALGPRWSRTGAAALCRAPIEPRLGVGYDGESWAIPARGQYCPFTDKATERAVLWKGAGA